MKRKFANTCSRLDLPGAELCLFSCWCEDSCSQNSLNCQPQNRMHPPSLAGLRMDIPARFGSGPACLQSMRSVLQKNVLTLRIEGGLGRHQRISD